MSMITLDDIHPDVAADLTNLRDKLTESGNGELAEQMVHDILVGIEERRNEAATIEGAEIKAAERMTE